MRHAAPKEPYTHLVANRTNEWFCFPPIQRYMLYAQVYPFKIHRAEYLVRSLLVFPSLAILEQPPRLDNSRGSTSRMGRFPSVLIDLGSHTPEVGARLPLDAFIETSSCSR